MSDNSTEAKHSKLKILLLIVGGFFISLIIILVLFTSTMAILPLGVGQGPDSNPANSPEESLARVNSLVSEQADSGVLEECRTSAFYNEEATRTIVLFHGITNCPAQYAQFTPYLENNGFNYVLMRLPKHGFENRADPRMADITVDEILETAQQSVDIAEGFGQPIEVFGLSAGGVVTAWLSENRPSIDVFYIVEPSMGFKAAPTWLGRSLTNGLRLAPNIRWWWESEENRPERPRYMSDYVNTNAMAQFFRIGHSVLERNRSVVDNAKVYFVVNENDRAVKNEYIDGLYAAYMNEGVDTSLCTIDASFAIDHDFIDPFHPDQRIDYVYPQLEKLLEGKPEQTELFNCT